MFWSEHSCDYYCWSLVLLLSLMFGAWDFYSVLRGYKRFFGLVLNVRRSASSLLIRLGIGYLVIGHSSFCRHP